MELGRAQASRVVALPGLLSAADVARVHSCASSSPASAGKDLSKHDGRWETLYLHSDGHFQRECADILAKILREARRAEAAEPSMCRVLSGVAVQDVGCRCIEYHEVRAGGGLPDPHHHDIGSLVTVDIMLGDPATDFEGGEFHTLESDGSMQPHAFARMGDALMFVSHKYHCVQPVRAGLRRVLVLEFWLGPERRCAHRCDTPPQLPCSHSFRPEKLAATRGLNTVLDALDSGDPAMAALAAAATECLDPLTISQMAEVRQSKMESETATVSLGEKGGRLGHRNREKRGLRVMLPASHGSHRKIRRFTVPNDARVAQVLRRLVDGGHLEDHQWRGFVEVAEGSEARQHQDNAEANLTVWDGTVEDLDEDGVYTPC
jgi:predicted 2-oxoglutarate/Fe(II)-dependent dioxygenase YbiX